LLEEDRTEGGHRGSVRGPRSFVLPVRHLLPYRDYLAWLAQYGFRHTHHVVFDHLVAPTACYLRRAEFAAWFRRAGLEHVRLSWRNRNSWRGYGEKRWHAAPGCDLRPTAEGMREAAPRAPA
jgi:hypothetical protein